MVVVELWPSLIDGEFGEEGTKKKKWREREGGEEGRRHIDFIAFACTGSYRLGPWASRAYDSLPNDPNKEKWAAQGCQD